MESAPDATTLLQFRHLLERHELTRQIFEEVGALLRERQLLMREGTMIDATIINAPSSTKNADGQRTPGMHQTKKGNAWYFGMKAHIGADTKSGLIHTVVGTAANVAEVVEAHALLHGEEKEVFADAGYIGVEKREEIADAHPDVHWHIAVKRGKIKALVEVPIKALVQYLEKRKAQVRARVEHPFHILKNLFHHRKTRYRGLAKNTAQLHTLFALVNLAMAKRSLLAEVQAA